MLSRAKLRQPVSHMLATGWRSNQTATVLLRRLDRYLARFGRLCLGKMQGKYPIGKIGFYFIKVEDLR